MGDLHNIQGAVTIVGDNSTTLNVDDTGSTASYTGTLTSTSLTGLGMGSAGITYSGLSTLNIAIVGNKSFTVKSTTAGTATNINIPFSQGGLDTITTLAGVDTINIGSVSSSGSIQSATIIGDGSTTLNVFDTGPQGRGSDTLTNTTLSGSNFQGNGDSYSGLNVLNVFLGGCVATVNVLSTHTGTPTTIQDSSSNDVINIASSSPASGGNLAGIQGGLTVIGDGSTTLNIDDSGSTAANTGALSGSALSGMGMAGINYSALATLNFWLGSGATNFTVQSTSAQTVTNINLQRATGAVSISTLAGSYTINIGSLTPAVGGILNNIQGAVNVTGDGNVTLNIDDTGSTATNTGTLTSSALTGLGMGAAGITYSRLAALNVSLGSGTNTFTVSSVAAGTITSVNVPNTQSSSKTTITTLQGTDIVNLGSASNWQGPGFNGFQGPVKVVGDGNDTLNVFGVGDPVPAYNTLTSTTLSVGSSQTQQITYSGQAALNIWLSNQGGNLMTIVSTNPGTVTTITGGGQTNVVNVESTASPTYIGMFRTVRLLSTSAARPTIMAFLTISRIRLLLSETVTPVWL